MNDTRAMGTGSERDLLGAVAMHGIEFLAAALGENTDQIDQHICALRRRLD
jgi:hypothetical protein